MHKKEYHMGPFGKLMIGLAGVLLLWAALGIETEPRHIEEAEVKVIEVLHLLPDSNGEYLLTSNGDTARYTLLKTEKKLVSTR